MKIGILGAAGIHKTVAQEALELLSENNENTPVVTNTPDWSSTLIKEPESFLFTKLPEHKEPWIDPKEPLFNHSKHKQTCDKKRKARKKKKRK